MSLLEYLKEKKNSLQERGNDSLINETKLVQMKKINDKGGRVEKRPKEVNNLIDLISSLTHPPLTVEIPAAPKLKI